jgi:hypothetical protein
VSDGLTYGISGSGYEIWPDSTGQWDWIEPYSAYISLTNAPGTPWYSAGDTNVNFEFQTSMLLKVRGPQIPSTNAADAYLEMELSAQDGRFIFLATYAGNHSTDHSRSADAEFPGGAVLEFRRQQIIPVAVLFGPFRATMD